MRSRLVLAATVALALAAAVCTGVAQAKSTGPDNGTTSGGAISIATVMSGNDDVATTLAWLQQSDSRIVYLGGYGGEGANAGSVPQREAITGTTDSSATSGTWASSLLDVAYFDVKAGNSNILYEVTPSLSGDWTTSAISVGSGQVPALSHIDFFGLPATLPVCDAGCTGGVSTVSTAPASLVPEPLSLGVLASGVAGLAVARRRRRRA